MSDLDENAITVSEPPAPLSKSEERTWAMLAHLSILLNIIAALVIYLVYKERSRYVAYQSMQSFIFQLVFWVGVGALAVMLWFVSLLFSIVLVGLCLMPVAFIISVVPIAALVYGVVAAIQCSEGADFQYWLVGDWVRGTQESP
jgi:uncharacterized Tic20 family protein